MRRVASRSALPARRRRRRLPPPTPPTPPASRARARPGSPRAAARARVRVTARAPGLPRLLVGCRTSRAIARLHRAWAAIPPRHATTPAWVFCSRAPDRPRAPAVTTRARALTCVHRRRRVRGGPMPGHSGRRRRRARERRDPAFTHRHSSVAAAAQQASADTRARSATSRAPTSRGSSRRSPRSARCQAAPIAGQRRSAARSGAIALRARGGALLGAHTGASVLFNFAVNLGRGARRASCSTSRSVRSRDPARAVVEAVPHGAVTASAFPRRRPLAGRLRDHHRGALQLHTRRRRRRAR